MQDRQASSGYNTSGKLFSAIALALTATGMALALADPPKIVNEPKPKIEAPLLFDKWPQDKKPDVVLVLSGQQHSFLKFCGCSQPQYGGFERRYNLLAQLKAKGWPIVPLDVGDIVEPKSYSIQDQTLVKYTTAMELLRTLGYPAIAIGQNEFNLPLMEGLSRYTLQKPNENPRVLSANIANKAELFPHPVNPTGSMIDDFVIVPGENGTPSVGAVAVVAPSVRQEIHDSKITFADNQKIIPPILKQFDDKNVALRVLLFQGTPKEAEKAAQAFPQFQVIQCRSMEEDPPAVPVLMGKTMIVNTGWKARYVGVIGAFRSADGKEFDLYYQLVKLGPEFETDPAKEKENPVLDLLQKYAQQVKDENLLARFPKSPHPMTGQFPGQKVEFIGTDKCKMCHQTEYAKWAKSGHSHAHDTLVKKATKPTLRQFDGECIRCHVVGFEHTSGFKSEKETPHLMNVGCENCHGPGSLHAANPQNVQVRDAMSPWRKPGSKEKLYDKGKYDQNVLLLVDKMCQKCHDIENDVNFKFEKFWPKIDHSRHGPVPKP